MRPTSLFSLLLALAPLAQADDWLYLTYPGDTLIGIGAQYLKNPNDWPKVQAANRVDDPRQLPANTRIKIPVELLKQMPAPARVTHVKGNARVRSGADAYRPLAVGEFVRGGETVLTGLNSHVTIQLADASIIQQPPGSRLTFGRLAAYGKTGMVATELNLEAGRLEARASKQQPPAGGFRVDTLVAVAGLRGTEFRLHLTEDGKTLHSEVLDGAVGIAAQGQEVLLAGGQGNVTQAGQPPAPARPLPSRPRLDGLPARIDRLPLNFGWPAAAGVTAWRAQVALADASRDILLDERFATPQARWDERLPNGNYLLRVRGIDADGLEGLAGEHPFLLDVDASRQTLPAAPTQLTAVDDYGRLRVAWQGEGQRYRLELAPDEDFRGEVESFESTAPALKLAILKPGRYWLRVTAYAPDGSASPPSAPLAVDTQRAFPWWLLPFLLLLP